MMSDELPTNRWLREMITELRALTLVTSTLVREVRNMKRQVQEINEREQWINNFRNEGER